MSELIDVLVVKPCEHPFIEKVKNNFDAIRKFLGGIIACGGSDLCGHVCWGASRGQKIL